MSWRAFPTAAAALLLALAAGCGGEGEREARVVREDFRVLVESTGRLEAAVAFEIGPPSMRDVWNYNLQWMIPEGARVKKGDVIARFDPTDLDEKLINYRAELEKTVQEREKEQRNLGLRLHQFELDLAKAEGELKKSDVELSVPDGLVSQIELEKLRLERRLAEKRVSHLREKIDFERELVASKLELLDVKRARWERLIAAAETAKQDFAVKAPVDGVVIYIPKGSGDRWEVGERVWMLAKILKVADVSSLRAEAAVLEVDAARVRLDQPATVTIDAVPGSAIQTRVGGLGRLVRRRSRQDDSRVFDAWLPIEDLDEELMRPGMGISAEIEVALLPDRLTVPLAAIRSDGQGTWVRLRGAEGSFERRAVELGPRDAERVVVEAGLAEGDVVLLPGGTDGHA